MSDIEQRIRDLLDEAEDHEAGPVSVSILEEAVRLADEANDDELGYEARMDLVRASTFGGFPEKALVAFTWCASKSGDDPDTFPESEPFSTDLLWVFKWITNQVPDYPQLSRDQIDKVFADMERRYNRHGYSLRPMHMNLVRATHAYGDPPEVVARHYEDYKRSRRDAYSDCRACEVNFESKYHSDRGEYEKALEIAEPLLTRKLGCAHVPHGTYSRVLLPLLRLDRGELAERYHKRGYEMVRNNRDFAWNVAEHVDYCVHTNQTTRATNIFERHLSWVADTRMPDRKARYWLAGRHLLTALQAGGKSTVKLRVPTDLNFRNDDGRYECAKLIAWFNDQVRAIGEMFDRRNGNDSWSQWAASHPWHAS